MRRWLSVSATAFLLGIALEGCVSETTVFHSLDGKYTGVCSGAGFGIIRGTMAISELNNCKDAYRRAGYIDGPAPLSGAQPAPVPLPTASSPR
jgi:hypothetical protein